MPGTLVLIGLYGPRISTGAFGFMSHVSSCDGPPISIRRMQFTSLLVSVAPERVQPEQCGEAEAQWGERAGVQKIAPAQAVAELDRAVRIQTKHRKPLQATKLYTV